MRFFPAAAVAMLLILSGCFLAPPTVEIQQGNPVITSGQILSLSAALTEPDLPDDFAFQWYVDDIAVSGATSDQFSYTAPVVTSTTSVPVKVAAEAAGRGAAESEVTVTVLPSSVTHINSTGSFIYSVELGANPVDVYFVFTNGGEAEAARPVVSANFQAARQLPPSDFPVPGSGEQMPAAWRGTAEATEFNRNPPAFERFSPEGSRALEFTPPPEILYDTEGEAGTINDRDTDVAATCRKVVDADGKRLNIWVADASWGDVTQAMVDALADRFMKTGTGNDIYDWVTGIFGEEWGSHGFSNLIPPDDEVTILLYDIGSDGLPGAGEGRVVGLFDAINNFTAESDSRSNERLMFFIDAALFADDTDENGTWSITDDFWPREVVSTLAHEFQHMIHFYQKAVKNNLSSTSDVWINEMCSMAAEDLIADKIKADGPRGVSWDDGTAGTGGNTSDRLARYNYYNDGSLTYWPSSGTAEETLPHYSLSYAFGSYLARNYDGPELFRRIVQNTEIDSAAIVSALAAGGTGVTFTGILQRWGASVLLSNLDDAPESYSYNSGAYFDFSQDGITYNAGSINLYNYYFDESGEQQSGPKLYSGSPVGAAVLAAASNTFYYAGGDLSGTKSWTITLPSSVKMTVVFK